MLNSLEKFKESYYDLESNIIDRYPEDNKILINKNASEEELNRIYSEVFILRESYLESVIDFHFETLSQTNENEWKAIMKEMNKIIQ